MANSWIFKIFILCQKPRLRMPRMINYCRECRLHKTCKIMALKEHANRHHLKILESAIGMPKMAAGKSWPRLRMSCSYLKRGSWLIWALRSSSLWLQVRILKIIIISLASRTKKSMKLVNWLSYLRMKWRQSPTILWASTPRTILISKILSKWTS